jgi:hypothetical protein
VAAAYVRANDEASIQIVGRQGSALLCADDREISLVCCGCGLGVGVFPELQLKHLIPPHRVSEDYFIRLVEGTYLSNFLLDYKWRHIIPQSPFGMKTALTLLKTFVVYRKIDRRKRFAWMRALAKARRIIRKGFRKPMVNPPFASLGSGIITATRR